MTPHIGRRGYTLAAPPTEGKGDSGGSELGMDSDTFDDMDDALEYEDVDAPDDLEDLDEEDDGDIAFDDADEEDDGDSIDLEDLGLDLEEGFGDANSSSVDVIDEDEVEDEDGDEDEVAAEENEEALEELEAEELELLDDEVAETLLLDEAAELRAIRRAELTLDTDAESIRGDEFVCQSCFLVKRTSQLANKRKLICKDCAG